MNISLTTSFNSGTDCLILPVFEGADPKKLDATLPKDIEERASFLLHRPDFEGKKLQTSEHFAENTMYPSVFLIGLGNEKKFTIRTWKQAIGATVIALSQKKLKNIAIFIPEHIIGNFGATFLAEKTTIAAYEADYAFDLYKGKENKAMHIEQLTLISTFPSSTAQLKKGISAGEKIASAINRTRTLGNTPPSQMTPTVLANVAQMLAIKFPTIKTTILSRGDMKKIGMGCVLGVAQGSHEEPKFVILEYLRGKKSEKPTVLVGKGITFDSGGLSIKPSDSMCDMKFDMLGAATVLGTIEATASLSLKKNIVGLFPTTENMPGGGAYRPDDILTAMNGKTVEIGNTDAEGRLILADALSYAKKYNPKEVIDFATLTGACLVAIGNERSGLFSPDDHLADKILKSANMVGEQLWRLPLGEEYTEAVKSEIADVKNVGGVNGNPRYGGASNAAAFLEHFTEYPWAHIDLSCSYYGGKGKPWIRVGANGFGVETMVEYLQNQ